MSHEIQYQLQYFYDNDGKSEWKRIRLFKNTDDDNE